MKNNIKLIVTDLDGTLVDSSSKVILENKIVLKALHDKGCLLYTSDAADDLTTV